MWQGSAALLSLPDYSGGAVVAVRFRDDEARKKRNAILLVTSTEFVCAHEEVEQYGVCCACDRLLVADAVSTSNLVYTTRNRVT